MWSGGPDAIGSVRPAVKWAKGLTCQTAKHPACHIQFVGASCFFFIYYHLVFSQSIALVKLFSLLF
jgi:hypothetical protein